MRCVAAARQAWLDWVEQAVEACACTPACTVSSLPPQVFGAEKEGALVRGRRRTGEGVEGGAGGSLEGGAVAEAGDRHVPHAVDEDEGHPLRGRHGSPPRAPREYTASAAGSAAPPPPLRAASLPVPGPSRCRGKQRSRSVGAPRSHRDGVLLALLIWPVMGADR